MSSVMALLIAGACTGMVGNEREACYKAIEAGGKQTGITQNLDAAEKKVSKEAEQQTRDLLGVTTFDILGGSAYLVKVAKEKSVEVNVPTFGLCDKINTNIGVDKYTLNLEWRFK